MKRRGLWKWLSIAFSLFVATAAIGVSFIDVGYAAKSGTLTGLSDKALGYRSLATLKMRGQLMARL